MAESFRTDRRTALKFAGLAAATGSILRPKKAKAEPIRVLPADKVPSDRRLGDLKDLNGDFTWKPLASIDEWKHRSDAVRQQLLISLGLWPMPTKNDLNPIIHGRVDREGYTVDRVILHTGEGLYCTGSLYRPKAPPQGKYPAVLCPHGHWLNGRFFEHTEKDFANELATKAESLPGGRYPLQARCVQLARMGCVVFIYDMLGYADNVSLPFEIAHGFKKQREDLSRPERWGIFSAQSELRCLNVVGLQTWNSIRALDWISSLPDVDANRIGVTGASGGGTQTFLLGAIDARPAAFFPAVMVSNIMQGGCTCENASYLRVNTGNVEFAAMLAPRPLGMTGANDWTEKLESQWLPELKRHYAMMGAPDNVVGKYFSFPHNYNQPSRLMMYEFFNRHLKLGQPTPIVEHDYVPLTRDEATVWGQAHPAPDSSVENELKLVRGFAADQEQQFEALVPKDQSSFEAYRSVVGAAWSNMIGRSLPGKDELAQENQFKAESDEMMIFRTLIQLKSHQEEIPVCFFLPRHWNKQVAIWITDQGKQKLVNDEGTPHREVKQLLNAGISVVIPDLLYQGDFLEAGQPLAHSRAVKNNSREFVGYTLGYNHPLFAQRVHDVLTLIAFCRFSKYEPEAIHLIGLGRVAGPIVAAAAAQAPGSVKKIAIGTNGFRFQSLTDAYDPSLLPGAVKFGDVPGLLGLLAKHSVWLSGEKAVPQVTQKCFAAAGSGSINLHQGAEADELSQAASWIAKNE